MKRLLLGAVLLLAAAAPMRAFSYRNLPDTLCGSMMPYDFRREQSAALPDSLRAVHVEYVARHGSRFLSGEKKVGKIRKALLKAREEGTITPLGLRFLSFVDSVRAISSWRWGALSKVGKAESARLGREMYADIPALSADGAEVDAVSSPVPRVVMTMYQFLHAVNDSNENLNISTFEGPVAKPLLCPFITDRDYSAWRDSGAWKNDYNEFLDRHVSYEPALRMLGEGSGYSHRRLRELTMEIYGVIQGNRAYGLPAPTTEWMTVGEFRGCWLATNALHYYRNCITPQSDLAGKAIAPLLERIIDGIDDAVEDLEDGEMDEFDVMNCYFGHAETLLPLLSLMDYPAERSIPGDIDRLNDVWRVQDLTPLAANLRITLLRAESGEFYATVRLNGRGISPIPGRGEIVAWSELRAFWTGRIMGLKVKG